MVRRKLSKVVTACSLDASKFVRVCKTTSDFSLFLNHQIMVSKLILALKSDGKFFRRIERREKAIFDPIASLETYIFQNKSK